MKINPIIRSINYLISVITSLSLILLTAFASYCLFDNYMIINSSEISRKEIMKLKPEVPKDNKKLDPKMFYDLKEINNDIAGWLTIDNTKIDYPVVRAENNIKYLRNDIYGNYSVPGSIFMDFRCSADFSDAATLIYGHHMANGTMFGDIDKFKDEKFFNKNRTGALIVPDDIYTLKIMAFFIKSSSDDQLFNPGQFSFANFSRLLDYIESDSQYYDRILVNEERYADPTPQVLILSTCSNEFTNARAVLICLMESRNEVMSLDYSG